MLKAFFDETGTHDGSAITGLGGFVGTADAWDRLEQKWWAVLREYADKGVRWLHMSGCRGPARPVCLYRQGAPWLHPDAVDRAARERTSDGFFRCGSQ